jgi:hypothetical protein
MEEKGQQLERLQVEKIVIMIRLAETFNFRPVKAAGIRVAGAVKDKEAELIVKGIESDHMTRKQSSQVCHFRWFGDQMSWSRIPSCHSTSKHILHTKAILIFYRLLSKRGKAILGTALLELFRYCGK